MNLVALKKITGTDYAIYDHIVKLFIIMDAKSSITL